MKFIVISDTHGHHHTVQFPEGDVLIHAGDISDFGKKQEVVDFLDWFSSLPYIHKVFIGGNHDFFLEKHPLEFAALLPDTITYLYHNDYVIEGIKLWGSPIQPDLVNWAFGKTRGKEMEQYWKLIPQDTDILITHTPPATVLDKNRRGKSLGCQDLLQKVEEIKPGYHLFGHVHASYGVLHTEKTTFINASIMKSGVGPVNLPVIFEFQK